MASNVQEVEIDCRQVIKRDPSKYPRFSITLPQWHIFQYLRGFMNLTKVELKIPLQTPENFFREQRLVHSPLSIPFGSEILGVTSKSSPLTTPRIERFLHTLWERDDGCIGRGKYDFIEDRQPTIRCGLLHTSFREPTKIDVQTWVWISNGGEFLREVWDVDIFTKPLQERKM